MMLTKVRRLPVAAALVVGLLASACGGGDTGGSDEPFTVTMAVLADQPRLDPQSGNNVWVRMVHFGNVSEPLVQQDTEGEVVGILAESWELVEDGAAWRFHLRRDVEFSNGEPFNAEAVAFSLDRITDPDYAAAHGGFFTEYDRTEIVDEHTVDIYTNAPAPDFPLKLTLANMVPPGYTVDFSPEGPMETQLAIGTGPYEMVSKTSERVVLRKRSDYWGGTTEGPDEVVLLPRPEVSSAVAALNAGEVDIVTGIPVDLVDEVPAATTFQASSKLVVQINAHTGPGADPRIREAIIAAVDQEGIRRSLFGDEYSSPGLCQYVNPGVFGFNPSLGDQPYDPDRASQLVTQAGATGTTLRLLYPVGRYDGVGGSQGAELIAENLQDAGFTVDILAEDFQTFLSGIRAPTSERVEMFIVGATFDTGTTQSWATYATPGAPLEAMPYEENPELGQLVVQQAQELDADRRLDLIEQVSQGICESNATLFLWSVPTIFGHGSDIQFPPRVTGDFIWSTVRRAG